ncbi:phosphoglycolate phosphatase [Robbsia sp. Bb-Pol-6]|uniref:Phosphoglycolate phosphatase n=1 Tax=Robbsia betulipollinis TaxID=2981849 RepID=A0ABT3ZNY4_9BURK|nr:phosphoglycolate phosphatase [Robbsia betulipollinis]MCY0388258.1 phosphoglycolate phosphatase [Robbsia betulipollinis]
MTDPVPPSDIPTAGAAASAAPSVGAAPSETPPPFTPRALPPGLRAAIVDLDGTMLDTADDFTAALNGVLSGLSLKPISRAEVIAYIGKGSERLIHDVLRARLSPAAADAAFERACADYQHEYGKINGHHAHLYPEVVEGLAALRGLGLKLACVTNKPERFARALLEHHDLARYFDAIYGGDSLPRKKPDPLPMRTACAALGATPQTAVAIGDSENDVAAARAAGLASLTVPYGYNHGKPVQGLETDAIVGTLLDAARLLGHGRAPAEST